MSFFADLPPYLQERVVCSISAAVKYEVPVNIVLAVAEKEDGKPGQWVRNSNGTHDVGPMQFNTAYLGDLTRYGITANDVAAAGCLLNWAARAGANGGWIVLRDVSHLVGALFDLVGISEHARVMLRAD